MSHDDEPGPTQAQRFGRWASEAARVAGYDIDSQRGGGRVEIARKTGMSGSTVGRILAGKTLPSPRYYSAWAEALDVTLREVLIEAGAVTADDLDAVAERFIPITSLTPEDAAPLLGITIPANVRLFVSMVENILSQERERPGNSGAA